jgi:D-aminoacyl-tRNA deacylase
MRAVIQRVKHCSVSVAGKQTSTIGKGMLVLLGIRKGDTESDAEYLAERCSAIRIFEDTAGKMNLSVNDVRADVMVVSQFTVYGDTRKGNRPSYTDAAPPEIAESLYHCFTNSLRMLIGENRVSTGIFRAMMDIELINNGPVTLIVESKNQSVNL